MIHRLYGTPGVSTETLGTRTLYYALGSVTHLQFASLLAMTDSDKVTITLKSPLHEPIILANRVPLLAFSGVHDFLQGASQSLQTSLNAGTGTTDYNLFGCIVALGALDLRATESQLEITVESTTASQAWTISVLNMETEIDEMIKYNISPLLQSSSRSTQAIFVYYATGTDVPFTDTALDDVTVTVEHANGNNTAHLRDCIAFTALYGQIEANSPRNVFCIYLSTDEQTDTVAYQLSGSDADSDLQILTVSKVTKTERIAASTPNVLRKEEAKTAGLSDSKKFMLAQSGKAVPAAQMRAAIVVADNNKKKILNKSGRNL